MQEDREKAMSFLEHLDELRRRLMWCVVTFVAALPVAWLFRETLFEWIKAPFDVACMEFSGTACALNYPSPTAGFTAYIAIAVTAAIALALPVIVYHAWAFVAPGLYQRERHVLLPLLLGTLILFTAGTWLCRAFVLPRAFAFLLANSPGTPMIMVDDYLAFFVRLSLAFGLAFELPVVVLVLAMAGIVNHRQLLSVWRYFVVAAFVLGAFLTPPDMASQLALGSILCVLYGVSVGLAWAFGRSGRSSGVELALLLAAGLRARASWNRLRLPSRGVDV